MDIHALSTGTLRVKQAFLYPREGPRRQLDLFLPDSWSGTLPIHCWAIRHEQRLLLVDTGESSRVRDVPFARFDVRAGQELPGVLLASGLSIGQVSEVVLTHHHGDHVDGVPHVRVPVRMSANEIAFIKTPFSRLMRRVLRQPLPPGFSPEQMTFDDGPFGAFPRSRTLSDDGRIVAVETPGHTPGHISVICVDDHDRHVFIAGDATDSLEQLHARRADAIGPDPEVHVETLDRILEHCRKFPTVYLPTHDPQSAERLAGGVAVAA
jgi:glyoxylase-like metal-dependent hydrolase (beta-lactamase superfamily II)